MKATGIHSETLLGVGGPYPQRGGNCFTVETEEGSCYTVTNFRSGNLGELVRRGIVSWPIDVEPVGDHWVKVTDNRIPEEWYYDNYCDICYPVHYR